MTHNFFLSINISIDIKYTGRTVLGKTQNNVNKRQGRNGICFQLSAYRL